MTRLFIALPLMLLVLFAGCIPDQLTEFDWKALQPPPVPPPSLRGKEQIAQETEKGVTATLFAHGGARQGDVLFEFAWSGVASAPSQLTLHTHARSLPLRAVSLSGTSVTFEGMLFAENNERAWVKAEWESGLTLSLQFPVEHAPERMATWTTGADTLVLAWGEPARPRVGVNTFTVTLFRVLQDRLETLPNATVDLFPWMDMGGGDGHSTPYDPPQHSGAGRYTGRVDFSMSGRWDMTVYASLPGLPRATFLFPGFYVFD